jgi:MerR family transcriptional regulator/heat shock protein HspR
MPEKYYTIGVVSEMVELTQQTIRLYESRGLIHPKRTKSKKRLFSDQDLEKLRSIKYLSQELGVNLAGIEIIFRMKYQILELQEERKQLIRILYEASDYLKRFLDEQKTEPALVKSSLGTLINFLSD